MRVLHKTPVFHNAPKASGKRNEDSVCTLQETQTSVVNWSALCATTPWSVNRTQEVCVEWWWTDKRRKQVDWFIDSNRRESEND
ncbi:hypothetical protein B9Z55_024886 [Caenorhabditis nigoni]|uniref:Uncharacterized protein n=1 Tax=Caenorhabditis nigoni TaxID=1611254 RepID=A0A2G5SWF9_9PELO|nr:hypothetical protein B9Z55_024886 [Caenorhabditis nigoni]